MDAKTHDEKDFVAMLDMVRLVAFDSPGYYELTIEPMADGRWDSYFNLYLHKHHSPVIRLYRDDDAVREVVVANILKALRDLDYYKNDGYDCIKIEIAPGIKDIYVHVKAYKRKHKVWQKTLGFALKRKITECCLGKIQSISPCKVAVLEEVPNK